MWKKLYDLTNLLFNFGQDLQRNRADIKQLQNEMRELSAATQSEINQLRAAISQLAYEVRPVEENAAHENEKRELRREIERLREVKQISQGKSEFKSAEGG